MTKTKIVYQINGNGKRYAGITLNQLAKAMWAEWKKVYYDDERTPKQVTVDFASDTTFKEDVSIHHGLLLHAPFSSLILITGRYGGYDFGSTELYETDDELGIGAKWKKSYPDMSRQEVILLKSLEKIIWDEWKDENGLLWCDVIGAVENYLDTLDEDQLEVINNT